MTSKNEEELFPKTYRHEFVNKTLKGLLERELDYHPYFDPKKKEIPDATKSIYSEIIFDSEKYLNPNISSEVRDKIEERLFFNLSNMTLTGTIRPRELPALFQDQAQSEIKKISDRLDSTNKLLREVMELLGKVLKKLD